MRRISFLSRPVSGAILSRSVQLGLARCHLSSSVISHKETPRGLRRESRRETATETGIYSKITPYSNPQNLHLYHKTCICANQDPDSEIENSGKKPGKSRIPNFCYIQVLVFDLSYPPVVAVGTQQVGFQKKCEKRLFYFAKSQPLPLLDS